MSEVCRRPCCTYGEFQRLLLNASWSSANVRSLAWRLAVLWRQSRLTVRESAWLIVFVSPYATTCPYGLCGRLPPPPGYGRRVTDFWGWGSHGAQLRCPSDVSGDIWAWGTRRGLKPKVYKLPRPRSPWGSSPMRENTHSRTGNRTRDLMSSSQESWPPGHEVAWLIVWRRISQQ
jgi:hypothetical protein